MKESKSKDMAAWYSEVVLSSALADYSPIKGCMIIRPYGYAIWQNIVDYFNDLISRHAVKNAYFPMFIPESFFSKEAKHAEGFAPEVAWVKRKDDQEERLALRPTSETIMYDAYSKWIRSHRDLPLKINQWCNIVRWEVKDVKPFLRSREFLWQEGHCVYETKEECHKDTLKYLEFYRMVAEDLMAVPVIVGQKSEKEKFAGADNTYTIEGFMPDGKALQMGTSHDLSQGFARAFDIKYVGKDKKEHYPFQNSWGISTRLIGALIMVHGDDKGLVLPPKIAPQKGIIIPILFDDSKEAVLTKAYEISDMLGVDVDAREQYSAGWKFNDWELKGVPIRIELGPKDIEKNQAVLVRRDTSEKKSVTLQNLKAEFESTLKIMQKDMFSRAKQKVKDSIVDVYDWDSFMYEIGNRRLVRVNFCGEVACEEDIKERSGGATSRCSPLGSKAKGKCFACGKEAKLNIYFSKSY